MSKERKERGSCQEEEEDNNNKKSQETKFEKSVKSLEERVKTKKVNVKKTCKKESQAVRRNC